VLLGAEISYVSQNIHNFEYEQDAQNISTRYKNFLTLFITYVIVKQYENQQPPLSAEKIAIDYGLPIRLVNQIITQLIEISVIIEVITDKSKRKNYIPAIDINQLSVNLLFSKLETHGSELFLTTKNELLDSFWQKTLAIKLQSEKQNAQLLIKDI